MNLIVTQVNYGLIKEENFTIQEWLDNNYILMYSTYNDNKSVIAGRYIKTSAKIYKAITANDSRSFE